MTKRTGVACLILIVLPLALVAIAFIRSDSLARTVASRATASIRSPRLLDQMPTEWIDVLLQVEDPSFFDHPGVDFRTPGQGWTTITQGIVKRYFPGPLAGVWGKSRQSLFALTLNRHLSKQQLQVFLAGAYFGSYDGRDLVGFEDASMTLFNNLSSISSAANMSVSSQCLSGLTVTTPLTDPLNTARVWRESKR